MKTSNTYHFNSADVELKEFDKVVRNRKEDDSTHKNPIF